MRVENPRTEEQIKKDLLWPDGDYDFEIAGAIEAVSKKNNDMIKLTLNVFSEDGKSRIFNDYIMEAMAFKLVHCVEVCGLMDQYASGNLDANDFIGKAGKVSVRQEEAGAYPAKNVIKDYVVNKDEKPTHSAAAVVEDALDDEVPW